MKCVILAGFLLTLLGQGYGNVLRCSLDGKDASCTNEEEKAPPTPEVLEEPSRQTECLAGSEWESNCHFCRCADSGVAECLKQDFCGDGVFSEPIQCKPNTTFQRDCNTCVCLESGLALCTIEFCRRSAVRTKASLPSGKECASGSTWRSRCNSCTCSESGYASCTEVACREEDNKPEIRCAPDTAWKDDCNTCWCTGQGRAVCTKMGCALSTDTFVEDNTEIEEFIKAPKKKKHQTEVYIESNQSDQELSHNLLKRSVCKPNQEFQSECNSCQCSSDGQTYTCTQNECLERDMTKEVEVFMESEGVDHIERHSVCKPSNTFFIGCNTCHCNPSGTDYSCTNKPCPLPDDVELFHELKLPKAKTTNGTCKAKAMFIKDCNVCWCNDDGTGYFCTRRVCVTDLTEEPVIEEKPEELRIIKTECRPNEVFELDCNMCHCNPDGKSFSCTRRLCLDQDDRKNASLLRTARAVQEAPHKALNCAPDQEFRLDCNKCLCDSSGQEFSCTRIDCHALNNNEGVRSKRGVSNLEEVTANCTPGSTFEQGCNACKCTTDGRHALCTNKKCTTSTHESQVTTDVHSSDADPGFRCNPGEQFKKDCNDCTCSADGRSTFCTLRLCDQDITPGL